MTQSKCHKLNSALKAMTVWIGNVGMPSLSLLQETLAPGPARNSHGEDELLTVLGRSVAEGEPQVAAVHILDGDGNLAQGERRRTWSGQHLQPLPAPSRHLPALQTVSE